MKRWQKNITITGEQLEFAKANHGKMTITQISKMLGISYQKAHNNLRLIGLVKEREKHEAKVIDMEEYFNIEDFGKYYTY